MTGNILEGADKERNERERKELEFQVAKNRLERKNKYHGKLKRKLNNLNNYYDYSPDMFGHIE